VYLQRPGGSLGSELLYRAPWNSGRLGALAIGDANGDGRPDIVAMNEVMIQRPVPAQAEGLHRPGRWMDWIREASIRR
jgi:hypothetical protein